jgi:hypothetical protein
MHEPACLKAASGASAPSRRCSWSIGRARPALTAMQILDRIDDPRFTHELGLFNLEANLSPLELGGDCLRQLEAET